MTLELSNFGDPVIDQQHQTLVVAVQSACGIDTGQVDEVRWGVSR